MASCMRATAVAMISIFVIPDWRDIVVSRVSVAVVILTCVVFRLVGVVVMGLECM